MHLGIDELRKQPNELPFEDFFFGCPTKLHLIFLCAKPVATMGSFRFFCFKKMGTASKVEPMMLRNLSTLRCKHGFGRPSVDL